MLVLYLGHVSDQLLSNNIFPCSTSTCPISRDNCIYLHYKANNCLVLMMMLFTSSFILTKPSIFCFCLHLLHCQFVFLSQIYQESWCCFSANFLKQLQFLLLWKKKDDVVFKKTAIAPILQLLQNASVLSLTFSTGIPCCCFIEGHYHDIHDQNCLVFLLSE